MGSTRASAVSLRLGRARRKRGQGRTVAGMDMERRSVFGWPATAAAKASPREGLVVHFDGGNRGLTHKNHAACRDYWKWCRRFHMGPERGWRDIGYSFAVCPHGVILEGRGLDREQAAQPGGNRAWYSVTFMFGPKEKPTPEQLAAFRSLREWLMGKGVAARVKGHRDFVSTDCPGDVLYQMVRMGAFTRGAADWMETMVRKLPTLRKGATGEDVQTVQALCLARSHPEVKITGTFDDVTEDAVKKIQAWAKIAVDGIVGPDTWAALMRAHFA